MWGEGVCGEGVVETREWAVCPRSERSIDSFYKKKYQGSTPLMFACSTGIGDVVILLAEMGADFHKVDHNQRGCLQLARRCQGDGQTLAGRLLELFPGLASSQKHRVDARERAAWRGLVRVGVGWCWRVWVRVWV